MTLATEIVLVAAGWIAYFSLHSALASRTAKQWVAARWPAAMAGYRIAFNISATLLLLPLLWAVLFWPSPSLWRFHGWAGWIADGLALAAVAGFIWTTRYYAMDEFLGTRQWREGEHGTEEADHLAISPLHRWVRHPWYTLGLVILWTRDMDTLRLTSALLITGYLVIGSRLEERKLLAHYGERYRRYCRQVPGILPRPWRRLTRRQAAALRKQDPGAETAARD